MCSECPIFRYCREQKIESAKQKDELRFSSGKNILDQGFMHKLIVRMLPFLRISDADINESVLQINRGIETLVYLEEGDRRKERGAAVILGAQIKLHDEVGLFVMRQCHEGPEEIIDPITGRSTIECTSRLAEKYSKLTESYHDE